MKLSILIPAYNEQNTIESVLNSLNKLKLEKVTKEIIVIDDGSTDDTPGILSRQSKRFVKVFTHKKNKGKGAAIQTGIKKASGDIILIQDADLEYSPRDIPRLIRPIIDRQFEVVYGTRLNMRPVIFGKKRTPFLFHFFGNKLLSLITTFLYGATITDMETGYKVFTRKALSGIRLNAKSFDFEPEITAKILKKRIKILEIDIKTNPRGYDEGKKIRPIQDGLMALWTLIKYRFVD